MPLNEHLNHQRAAQHAGVEIRAARETDLDDVCAMLDMPGVIRGTLQSPWTPRDQRATWLGSSSDRASRYLVATLPHNGMVVGSISLMVSSNPRTCHVAGLGMAVRDDYQRRGIGTALMSAAVHMADDWLDLRRIELTVYPDNAPAIALYETFGFQREGTLRDYAYRDGAFTDALMMGRVRPRPHREPSR